MCCLDGLSTSLCPHLLPLQADSRNKKLPTTLENVAQWPRKNSQVPHLVPLFNFTTNQPFVTVATSQTKPLALFIALKPTATVAITEITPILNIS